MLAKIIAKLRHEPVLLTQGAALLVSGAAAWGLELSKEQSVWVGAVAVFVAAVIGRSQVTPTSTVAAKENEAGNLEAGPASPAGIPDESPVDVVPAEDGSERYLDGGFVPPLGHPSHVVNDTGHDEDVRPY